MWAAHAGSRFSDRSGSGATRTRIRRFCCSDFRARHSKLALKAWPSPVTDSDYQRVPPSPSPLVTAALRLANPGTLLSCVTAHPRTSEF